MSKTAQDEQDLVKQIQSQWAQAQQKLEQLKRAVAENNEVSRLKARLDDAQKEREAKLLALGEAAKQHFSQAGQVVPSGLKAAFEAVKAAEAKLEKEKSHIRDLLAEADVVVSRESKESGPKKKGPR